ncbi:MAG: hypothetical protein GC193_09670 [Cryomorphaceae bacterium]|nr:hypothetical protein [Cryomorphaceae bacterium]
MAELTEQQIEFVSAEIQARGVNLSTLHDDLLDHICTAIERKMDEGIHFDSAFVQTIKLFGPDGLMQVQHQTLVLLTQMNETMKKLSLGFGLATVAFLLAGIFFKAMHWPGAGALVVLGNALLVCGYIPILLSHKLKESAPSEKITVVAGFVGLAVMATGITFKLMHWPTANILMLSGFVILALIYMPVYYYQRYKTSLNKSITITSAIISFICVILVVQLMNFKNVGLFNHGITVINEQLEENLNAAKSNDLLVTDDRGQKIHAEVSQFVSRIDKLKLELMAATQNISEGEAANLKLHDLSRANSEVAVMFRLFDRKEMDKIIEEVAAIKNEILTVFPADMQEAMSELINLDTNKLYVSIKGETQTWATYHFQNVSLIGAVSNLSALQLQVQQAENLALMYLKSQSEAQRPPSAAL